MLSDERIKEIERMAYAFDDYDSYILSDIIEELLEEREQLVTMVKRAKCECNGSHCTNKLPPVELCDTCEAQEFWKENNICRG